jgi:hypothetical protein
MAKEPNKTVQDVGPDGKIKSAEALFDELGGEEVFVDRAIVDWDDLGAQKLPVVGHLIRIGEYNLPPGAKRADNRSTWDGYVFQATRPTRACPQKKEIADVQVGRQVIVPRNPKNKELDGLLGQEHMVEVAILATHKIETANQPMWTFRIKVLGNPKKREGQYLDGGPGTKGALPFELRGAAALPVKMPTNASPAEREAAHGEVPFS